MICRPADIDRLEHLFASEDCALVRVGDVLLVQGDALSLLRLVPGVADLVLTDWPYALVSGGNSTGEMGGIFARDRYDNSGCLFPVVDWAEGAPLVRAACRESADLIVMANDRNLTECAVAMQGAGFKFHRVLVWDKGTVTPNRWFMQPCEFAFYGYAGRARPITDKGAKALVREGRGKTTGHPTEKPVGVMQHWITMCSDPGALVLDPFAGSGTTLVAAAQSGRCAVGFEITDEWFSVARDRLLAMAAAPKQEELI